MTEFIRLRQAATDPGLLLRPIQETLLADDYAWRMASGLLPEEFQTDSEIVQKIRTYRTSHVPPKFIAIRDLLLQILGGSEKAIIWTIFVQNAKNLQTYLHAAGYNVELLIGEVDQPSREIIVRKFNDPQDSDFRIVIANPFAVSESISLHKGCHNAIYLERDYNCASFLQSKDRIHRYGLLPDQPTNYYYTISIDSVDEIIDDRLSEKIRRMERIIDDEIPLFSRLDDLDETDIITSLIEDYARRTQ